MRDSALFDLDGRLAVVVGATEGTIGAAIAVALTRAGARVVLGGRDPARLAGTADRADAAGVAEVDVTDPDSTAAFADAVLARHGPAAILVNAAGRTVTKLALDVTPEDWDAVHDVQVRGVFFTCQAFARGMAAEGYGKIINLSSTWAVTAGPNRTVYSAAKAAVSHLTAALAVEWAPLGVRVNALGPTATMTAAMQQRLAAQPEREAYLRDRIPMGRLGTPDDLLGAAVFLAAPASDFVTGHTLFVDGGWVPAK